MNKYQIIETTEKFNHAGTKATADIAEVAKENGFQPLFLKMATTADTKIGKLQRQIGYWKDWKKVVSSIESNSIVLLQHPFHYPQLTREKSLKILKDKKNIKFISVIHDVEELRAFRYNAYYKREFEFMLSISDMYIVHNKVMKQYFIENNVPEEKIVVLGIFDYLLKDTLNKKIMFSKSLSIAGNLDTNKCKYISQLGKLKNIGINLYGSNYDEHMDQYENIQYKGSFAPDDVPNQLKEGFGLVWDGDSIEGCCGTSGQYLKYNNPHKLSLYLASGLPVVIWNEAAEAGFVKEHHLGICVDSLYEAEKIITELTCSEYDSFVASVSNISANLKAGYYSTIALNQALAKLL